MTELKSQRRSPALGSTPLIWDNASINAPASGVCITATDQEFDDIGNFLLATLAIRWPDPSKTDDREGEFDNFNEPLRNAAQRIALQMLSRLITCGLLEGDMKLRQKPDNPCVLQQLQDDEWVDVFDYEACLAPALEAQVDEQLMVDQITSGSTLANSIWREFEDLYTGTSASVDPELILTGTDEIRNRSALCKTIGVLVRNYVGQALKVKNEIAEGINRAALAVGIGAAVIALIAAILSFGVTLPASLAAIGAYLTVGNLGLAGAVLGLNAAGLAAWVQVIKDTEIAVLNDQSAVSDVVCIWYTNLKDETDISQTKFAETLDVSGESANTQALYAAIKDLIEQPLAYAAFLKTWKQEINLRKNGALEGEVYCECDAPDLVLEQISGYDNSIVYEGKEGDWDVYLLTSYFNGFQRGIAVAANPGGYNDFFVMEIEEVSGTITTPYTYQFTEPDVGFHYYNNVLPPDDVPTNSFVVTHPIADGNVVIRLKIFKNPV